MGFRALKKTLEAPYTTKVNNRDRTSRGTTPNNLNDFSAPPIVIGTDTTVDTTGLVTMALSARVEMYPRACSSP